MNYIKRKLQGFKFLKKAPEQVEQNDIVIVLQTPQEVMKRVPSTEPINWENIKSQLDNDEDFELSKQLIEKKDVVPNFRIKHLMEKLIPIVNNAEIQHELLSLWEQFKFGDYIGFEEASTMIKDIDYVNCPEFADMHIVNSETKHKLSTNDTKAFTDNICSGKYLVYEVKHELVVDNATSKLINYAPLMAINRNGVKLCPKDYKNSSLWRKLEDVSRTHNSFRLIFVSPNVQVESEDWYTEPNVKNTPVIKNGGEIINVAFHFMCIMFYGQCTADNTISLDDIYSI